MVIGPVCTALICGHHIPYGYCRFSEFEFPRSVLTSCIDSYSNRVLLSTLLSTNAKQREGSNIHILSANHCGHLSSCQHNNLNHPISRLSAVASQATSSLLASSTGPGETGETGDDSDYNGHNWSPKTHKPTRESHSHSLFAKSYFQSRWWKSFPQDRRPVHSRQQRQVLGLMKTLLLNPSQQLQLSYWNPRRISQVLRNI